MIASYWFGFQVTGWIKQALRFNSVCGTLFYEEITIELDALKSFCCDFKQPTFYQELIKLLDNINILLKMQYHDTYFFNL